MTRYRKFKEPVGGGWSQWEELGRTTFMACCDCGLVHGMRFRVRVKNNEYKLHLQVRRHKTRTKARRKQIRHAFNHQATS